MRTSQLVTTTIYLLSEPDTGRVRYVGKTTRPWRVRLLAHINDTKRLRHYCANWIRSLGGVMPTLTSVEEVCGTAAEGTAAERRWIAKLRADGCVLTNLTDGGEGMSGHVPSEATRAKRSAALVGRYVSPETRLKIGMANRGRVASEDARRRMSEARRGKKMSADTCAKHAAYRHSPETRAKIGAAHRGRPKPETVRAKLRRPKSPEHVAKMAAAHRGLKHSEEAKEKMAASQRARWAKRREAC